MTTEKVLCLDMSKKEPEFNIYESLDHIIKEKKWEDDNTEKLKKGLNGKSTVRFKRCYLKTHKVKKRYNDLNYFLILLFEYNGKCVDA